jgi:hypothetical protein
MHAHVRAGPLEGLATPVGSLLMSLCRAAGALHNGAFHTSRGTCRTGLQYGRSGLCEVGASPAGDAPKILAAPLGRRVLSVFPGCRGAHHEPRP